MQMVALFLQREAIQRMDPSDKDIFGRSAYNRYYYATFLRVRKMMGSLDPRWNMLPHADYSDLLKGQITKTLAREKNKAAKFDPELTSLCAQAKSAAINLADLMKKASITRVIADYNPEIAVEFADADRFMLQNISINEAHQWVDRANSWSKTIEQAWMQINA